MPSKLQPRLWILVTSIIFMQVILGAFGAISESKGSKKSLATYDQSMLEDNDMLSRSHHHHHHHRHHGTQFDFLMFVQLWPITSCIDWKEREDHNTCILNDDMEWTIHGIWPTTNHKKGPTFCRNDLPFNEKQLAPILGDLEEHWLNVRNGTGEYSFWEHEWLKHGTCAVQIPELNTELKYFSKALEWQKTYDIHAILSDVGILPGGAYQPEFILDTVGKYLGKAANGTINPAMTCRKEHGYPDQLIYELVICFDKELKLMNCDNVAAGTYGGCPHHDYDEIMYPRAPNLGGTPMRYGITFFLCFVVIATCFVGALFRERTCLGTPGNGFWWNKCYRHWSSQPDKNYVHPTLIDEDSDKNTTRFPVC